MSTTLTIDDHLDALRTSVARLLDVAANAPQSTPVPTCPRWDLRALIAHVVMVHAWAAENVRGREGPPARTQTELRRSDEDLALLLAAGADDLVDAIRTAPAEAAAMVFLLDAPPPRAFWARRQAHETTIHAADALSAALGRMPTAAESAIAPALAVDGIDELVQGFLPRGASRWRVDEPFSIAVVPTDADVAWTLDISAASVEVDTTPRRNSPGCRFSGTAAELYLGLWNRGGDIRQSGRPGTLEMWHAVQRVRWS
ncbi:uncharacterized protein (TIGR03083 family) [Labedella gwakjiensis]|uniref:Uncharacterized protein (TIGR03083 family) n=1 Tax=Labedella gwakjiensis TaxID=390269 RepID=A0A2P8GXL6_9MICO|nr:maleylpyruvate isomerase family mycothiol-dependent enzyme [Labedella gwakjiensis]PSL38716.1 uncharacterized protein (TIGR03083 family) [Labedella gwakjiensis]